MKKPFLFSLIVCACQISLFAQSKFTAAPKPSSVWLTLVAGPNVPIGSFNNDKNENGAGWAEIGWICKGDIGIGIYENIGLIITPAFFQNPVNKKSAKGIIQASGHTFEELNTKPWKFRGVFIGPEFRLPSVKSPFFLKLQLGYIHCTSPYINYWVGVPGYTVSLEQKDATDAAFGTNIGAGFKFNLNDLVLLTCALEYTSVKPSFKNVPVTLNENGKYLYTFGDFDMHVTNVLLSLGLTWKL